jgi:hypothetical protein
MVWLFLLPDKMACNRGYLIPAQCLRPDGTIKADHKEKVCCSVYVTYSIACDKTYNIYDLELFSA